MALLIRPIYCYIIWYVNESLHSMKKFFPEDSIQFLPQDIFLIFKEFCNPFQRHSKKFQVLFLILSIFLTNLTKPERPYQGIVIKFGINKAIC